MQDADFFGDDADLHEDEPCHEAEAEPAPSASAFDPASSPVGEKSDSTFSEMLQLSCQLAVEDEVQRAMWIQATRFLVWHWETMGKFPWNSAMAKATGLKADDVQHCRTFADLDAYLSKMNVKSRLRPMAINLGIEIKRGAHMKNRT